MILRLFYILFLLPVLCAAHGNHSHLSKEDKSKVSRVRIFTSPAEIGQLMENGMSIDSKGNVYNGSNRVIFNPKKPYQKIKYLDFVNRKIVMESLVRIDLPEEYMDELFWKQAYGSNKDAFLASITDEKVRKFAQINYGPWDRLNGDTAFLSHIDEKPLGAQFYPADMDPT